MESNKAPMFNNVTPDMLASLKPAKDSADELESLATRQKCLNLTLQREGRLKAMYETVP